jgi:hypothetical protein
MSNPEAPTKPDQPMTRMQVTPLAAECSYCETVIELDQRSYETEQDMLDDLMVQLEAHNAICPKFPREVLS